MQTFLPYPSFSHSAQVLDRQRLGKQRIETLQLLKALLLDTKWKNHPAAKMWKGFEEALALYGIAICNEWTKRGYRDSCRDQMEGLFPTRFWQNPTLPPFPLWLGDDRLHASHRSNLLRKDPIWYGKFGWTEGPNLPYFWPVGKE